MNSYNDFQNFDEKWFRTAIAKICDSHLPSNHVFFSNLKSASTERICDPKVLDNLYRSYQAAMHASRAMGYFLPHLDVISLRVQKLKILAEDDGILGGDTHHYQLRRTWTSLLNRPPAMSDDEFGELDLLAKNVDSETSEFIYEVQRIYPLTLGPWVIVEGLAHNWIGALMTGLAAHFPDIRNSDYFLENYFNCLEVEHAKISLEVTCSVLSKNADLVYDTIDGAKLMGQALDKLWCGFDRIIK